MRHGVAWPQPGATDAVALTPAHPPSADPTGHIIDLVNDQLPDISISEEDKKKNLALLEEAKLVSERFLTRRGRKSRSSPGDSPSGRVGWDVQVATLSPSRVGREGPGTSCRGHLTSEEVALDSPALLSRGRDSVLGSLPLISNCGCWEGS